MILIINTADQKEVFIGIVNEGKLVAKKKFQAQYQQAEKLLPKIDDLLQATSYSPRFAGVAGKLQAIKTIAVVSGPGPFTALRIGVITANTLAWVLKIPVVGIKLTEFEDINGLVEISEKKVKKSKKEGIVEPFYGKEPNITIKKN